MKNKDTKMCWKIATRMAKTVTGMATANVLLALYQFKVKVTLLSPSANLIHKLMQQTYTSPTKKQQ